MNRKIKTVSIAFALYLALYITVVVAASYWHMEITWTLENTAIGVYKDSALMIPWDHTLALTGVTSPQTFDFYIKNEGNVPVDVTVTNEVIVGAAATWTPTSISNLAPGTNLKMTLTLTLTSDGSYNFDFASNKHTG